MSKTEVTDDMPSMYNMLIRILANQTAIFDAMSRMPFDKDKTEEKINENFQTFVGLAAEYEQDLLKTILAKGSPEQKE